jgi:cell division protein FtsB
MTSLKERFILRAAMLLMALCPLSSFAFSHELRQLLDSLDDAVARRQTALAKKQQVIDDLKRGITDLPNDGALVAKYEQIFQEYLHFNGDSALAYAKRSVVAAEHTGQPALILTAKFCLLRAYTRQGLLGKGYEVINSIGDINAVPAVYRSRYADHLLDFYMRVSQQNDFTVPAQDAKAAWGTYSQYLVNGSPEYLFYQAVCTGKGDKRRINQALRMLNKPSFLVANLYFALALDERLKGNENGFYENLILSAVNDMLLGNTEVSSLLMLLQTPLLECDLKRSSNYIQVCSDNIKRYHDMLRALKVVAIQDRINSQLNKERSRQMTVIIVIAVFFFVALVVSIVFGRLASARGRKVKRSLDALRDMHNKQSELMDQQKQMTEELRAANSRLSDRIAAYRKDFANVYHLVSTYITHEKSEHVELYNMLKSNNVRKAIRLLDSNTVIDGQLKHFYTHFDHAFLAMYPDFIQRMNSLVRPEFRYDEKQTELSTPLRIYALLVLGVTDSVGIADFLHLSSQTVYNYRLKMRRCALGDEKQFDDDVMRKFSYRRSEG